MQDLQSHLAAMEKELNETRENQAMCKEQQPQGQLKCAPGLQGMMSCEAQNNANEHAALEHQQGLQEMYFDQSSVPIWASKGMVKPFRSPEHSTSLKATSARPIWVRNIMADKGKTRITLKSQLYGTTTWSSWWQRSADRYRAEKVRRVIQVRASQLLSAWKNITMLPLWPCFSLNSKSWWTDMSL
jgi:hypothetical protein